MMGAPDMSREFAVIIERDSEEWFVATVPALHSCHTQARSLDELLERVQEAIVLSLDVQREEPTRLEFVGVLRVRVP